MPGIPHNEGKQGIWTLWKINKKRRNPLADTYKIKRDHMRNNLHHRQVYDYTLNLPEGGKSSNLPLGRGGSSYAH